MTKFGDQEKRKYLRLKKRFVIRYEKGTLKKRGYDLSQTLNVSKGGLLFFTSEPFEKGDGVSLQVHFPFMPETTSIKGEVVGCEMKREGLYQTRIKFVELPPEVYKEFEKYVDKMKQQERPY